MTFIFSACARMMAVHHPHLALASRVICTTALTLAIIGNGGCGVVDERKQPDQTLLLIGDNTLRVRKLDGIGALPEDQLAELTRKSSVVIKAQLAYFRPYTSATVWTDHGLETWDTICLFFLLHPQRDVYKGSWPSAGIVIEDQDLTKRLHTGIAGFYDADDEYLIFLEGATPIESKEIIIRRLTCELPFTKPAQNK